ncbi:tRNA uridine-5-carboxymethylaminomethyl(34) synthesis GTPase MnmE [Niabella yanshanensis]|uniref:tRNA modification GTPase MnmE n=1 Tax=Niabella yanshanensis TaxID=577386 RepID=A0ABZ0VZ53_9BACT|nr:tRNA uridine-5-carboxymethylaminomethyl(34) synthesis GTPase MnmE [Niabella yanshanensis]WQD36308.1 tRNA uridine-5-carboxymethylaminomethyl(34) synthesis GTPase MnmE [Niabella yanshanensis]
MNMLSGLGDTIVALATAPGVSAIGVIRLSGADAIHIADKIFRGKNLLKQASHTIHFGHIISGDEVIDEVVVSLYLDKRSYTGENTVEISGHGSPYILGKIIEAAVAAGARLARPGEYTQRAFLNGKLDLAQAEAVADLIAANSKAAQQTALNQLRGGFSSDLKLLRDELINFAALIELELDFSDEDVEFADRTKFQALISNLKSQVSGLLESFKLGNAIKNGISVAIIGKPNAGKSTLLNALLNEERAIVSDIAGTTRDTIEESLNIGGILFRLIDTAGIREHSTDTIENLGIERSKQNAEKADIIIHLLDATDKEENDFDWLKQFEDKTITVLNKADVAPVSGIKYQISISAKNKNNIEALQSAMYEKAIGEAINTESTIVTNARHHEALQKIIESIDAIEAGMQNNLSGDLLTIDIRRALHYLGEITGQVEVDRDILGTIFGKFCIGK